MRTKGELEEGLKELKFERLSLFHPSMSTAPKNRYGASQAVALSIMPLLDPLFMGGLNKFKSISAARLGTAIAMNLFQNSNPTGVNVLHWNDFMKLSKV